ncbi:MAG: hypothetical protein KIT58_18405 [Planctomycetota bacterium]|nr:hypothetical protein [Planctomycetota bacterium]
MPDPRRDGEGMIDLATFERLDAARREALAAEAAQNAADELPASLTRDRLAELKDAYRTQIEERLKNRRRQRRLMRGGEAPR